MVIVYRITILNNIYAKKNVIFVKIIKYLFYITKKCGTIVTILALGLLKF